MRLRCWFGFHEEIETVILDMPYRPHWPTNQVFHIHLIGHKCSCGQLLKAERLLIPGISHLGTIEALMLPGLLTAGFDYKIVMER